MSCHYSCSACSAPIYMYYCTACPSTRYLSDSTCRCISGYYERQSSECYPASQAGYTQFALLPVANGLFYVNIVIFWVYMIATFCRVNLNKIRAAVNFGQAISLLLYYPFIMDQLSNRFIWAISALNFSYFTATINTCSSTSIVCKMFQYIWEPILVFPALVACFFISFFLMNLIYKMSLVHPISLHTYWILNWKFIIFSFFDLTALLYSYNITKAILLSYWGIFQAAIYLGILTFAIYHLFKIVNSEQQSKIIYRSKLSWAYGYDENYHLHFIDFLYNEARNINFDELDVEDYQVSNNLLPTQEIIEIKKEKIKQEKKEDIIKRFAPHSNLYIFEILFKIMMGSTTALLYYYKPAFIVLSLVLLVVIAMCWLGTFFYYEKTSLCMYIIFSVCTILCATCYWISFFWVIAVVVGIMITATMVISILVLPAMNIRIGDKLLNKIFQDEGQTQKHTFDSNSQEELFQSDKNSMKLQQQSKISEKIPVEKQPIIQTKREPFQGNLTRKTKTKSMASQTALVQKTSPSKPKGKQIFIGATKQQLPQPENNNKIRHSQYQARISDIRSKVHSKGKPENILFEIEEAQAEQSKKLSNILDPPREKLNSQMTNKKKSRESKLNEQEFLSNILQQEKEKSQPMDKQTKN